MQKTVVRIMALLLVVLMCLTLLPIRSWADYEYTPETCPEHEWEFEKTERALKSAATCTASAMYFKTCAKCGTLSAEEVVVDGDPLGHDLGAWTDTATCTEGGTKTRSCSRSGCDYTETEATNALGHDFSIHHDAVAVTCTTDGFSEYYTCSRCGAQNPEHPMTTVTAPGHKWVTNPTEAYLRTEATCTEKATYFQSCETCGAKSDTMFFVSGEPLGHHWVENAKVNPTCAEQGTEAYKECDRCHIKDPADAPVSIAATGNHTWDTIVDAKYLKSAANCIAKGQYYQSCKVCGLKSETLFFESGEPLGHHWVNGVCDKCNAVCAHPSFGEDGACTICGLHKYRFIVNVGNGGSATWNENAVKSGSPVEVLEGTAVQVILLPSSGYVLDTLSVSGGSTVTGSGSVSFTMNTTNDGLTISCTFKKGTAGKQPIADVTKASLPNMNAVSAVVASLASANNVKTSEIGTFGYDVTPYWDGDKSQPVSNDDITAPISFTIPYPTGFSPAAYNFSVYHYKNGGLTELTSVASASGVISSSSSFSPMVLFATPVSSKVIVDPAAKAKQDPPLVYGIDFLDDAGGAITGTTTDMMYRKKGSTTYAVCKAGSTPVLSPGVYYVLYPETATAQASAERQVNIGSYYTVTAKHLYGKGTYYTDRPKLSGYDNVFVVPSGETISFTFTPSSGYWLHEINKSGRYVGWENVKRVYTTKIVDKSVVSFGFSSSTSSPKTADPNQDVLTWGSAALVSLIGMTTITWYLFRRKEY